MTRIVKTIVAAALLVFPAVAVAQDSTTRQIPDPPMPSPRAAQAFSLIGTAIPIGMMGRALASEDWKLGTKGFFLLIPGPSIGYVYGGQPWRGLASAGVRLAGATAFTASLAICWDFCSDSSLFWASVLGWGGLGLMAVSAVYDVARVGLDVQRANVRRASRAAPTIHVAADGVRLGLLIRF